VLLKIPHIFTNLEYVDMLYVHGFCDGSAIAAVEKYRRRFPMCIIPDRRVFSEVFNTLRKCGTLPSGHVSSEQARQEDEDEQENILEMVERSSIASTRIINTPCSLSHELQSALMLTVEFSKTYYKLTNLSLEQ
jgi:hypothetical protein